MYNKEKSMMITGHRTLPKGEELSKLKENITAEIKKAVACGFSTIYVGGAVGFDLLCAEVVLKEFTGIFGKKPKKIRLVTVVPFREQDSKYSLEDKKRYQRVIACSNEVVFINEKYHRESYRERNQYMVDNSSKVICYYNCSTN